MLTFNIKVSFEASPGLQSNLPSLLQNKLYTCPGAGAAAMEQLLVNLMMSCWVHIASKIIRAKACRGVEV